MPGGENTGQKGKAMENTYADNRIAKRGYGISKEQLRREIALHKAARESNDTAMMNAVEDYLTAINYHSECGALASGDYEAAMLTVKNWDN